MDFKAVSTLVYLSFYFIFAKSKEIASNGFRFNLDWWASNTKKLLPSMSSFRLDLPLQKNRNHAS